MAQKGADNGSMLELSGDHIKELGDEDLRTLVIKLCEAELRAAQHLASAVRSGGNQTAKDGGVDVRVELPAGTFQGLDFIPRAATVFQVKCEDMPEGAIKEEMRPGGKLRESIKDLIDRRGAYVIVSSKGTVSDLFLKKRKKAMADAVASQPNASQLALDFYDRTTLARWVRQYAGIELWVRDRVNARLQGWQGFAAWAGGELGTPYLEDDTARLETRGPTGRRNVSIAEGADLLREKLRGPGGIVRLIGLSGTGKTRMIQALFEQGLGGSEPLSTDIVRYTDLGHSPEPNARDMLSWLGANRQRAIVIVDNCNPATHNQLAELAQKFPQHLSLLTVEYDVVDDDAPDATEIFHLDGASDAVVRQLLERRAPHLEQADIHLITSISGGNARIALALARTVEQGESLGTLNDSDVFKRLFRQGQQDDPTLLRAAEACSLVYSFDAENIDNGSELHALASLAGMSAADLYRQVDNLLRRELVQKRAEWRALLPPALANRLAKSALKSIPRKLVQATFVAHPRLLSSFSKRLSYLDDSDEAKAIAREWLADPSWLGDMSSLDESRRQLLFRIAPLSPRDVLAALERALAAVRVQQFAAAQKDSLSDWTTLARHLAFEAADFDRAAQVLLQLAELQQDGSLECKNAFRELFWIGLSGNLAPLDQRIRFLRLALASQHPACRELALSAVAAMLEIGHISTSHDFTFGSRANAYGWQPETREQVGSWLSGALTLTRESARSGTEGFGHAKAALHANFRDLWAQVPARTDLADLMKELAAGGWSEGWVSACATLRFDGKDMPTDVREELRELCNSLAPQGLAQETLAFTSGAMSGLDIAETLDESDAAEDANPMGPWERVFEKAKELGSAAVGQLDSLRPVLEQLHHGGDNRTGAWGEGLGSASVNPNSDWQVLKQTFEQAGQDRNVAVLRGFIKGLRSRDAAAAERLLDASIDDPVLASEFGRLLDVPAGDSDVERLRKAIAKGAAPAYTFTLRTLGSFGPEGTRGLSVAAFCELAQVLSHAPDGLLSVITDVDSDMFGWRSNKLDVPLELLQLGRLFLERFDFNTNNQHVVARVTDLAKRCICGAIGEPVARALASKLVTAMEDYRTPTHYWGNLARLLFQHQPAAALDNFMLAGRGAKRTLRSASFYRRGPVIHSAPVDDVVRWVAVDPDARGVLVAAHTTLVERKSAPAESAVDEIVEHTPVRLSQLAERLLEVVPNKRPVLDALAQSLHPMHYSGSVAATLAPFLNVLEQMSASTDKVIAGWATEQIASVRARIEQDRQRESHDEERFEW
jgi:hypothetical protein